MTDRAYFPSPSLFMTPTKHSLLLPTNIANTLQQPEEIWGKITRNAKQRNNLLTFPARKILLFRIFLWSYTCSWTCNRLWSLPCVYFEFWNRCILLLNKKAVFPIGTIISKCWLRVLLRSLSDHRMKSKKSSSERPQSNQLSEIYPFVPTSNFLFHINPYHYNSLAWQHQTLERCIVFVHFAQRSSSHILKAR